MLKHVVEVGVMRYYHIIVDDPSETMSESDAALIGFKAAKENPDLLCPEEGSTIDENDIEFATYWDCFDSLD